MENKEKLIRTIFDLVIIVDREGNEGGVGTEIFEREILKNIKDNTEQKIAMVMLKFDDFRNEDDELKKIEFDYDDIETFFLKRFSNKTLQNIKTELLVEVKERGKCKTKESISDYAWELL